MAALAERTKTELGSSPSQPMKIESSSFAFGTKLEREVGGGFFSQHVGLTENVGDRGASIKLSHDESPDPVPRLQPMLGEKYIDAVVAARVEGAVLLNCVNAGVEFTLRLPESLVPSQLDQPGKPVRISLRSQGGIRLPVVEARQVANAQATPDPDLDAWIDSL